jgi:phospholipase C
MATLASAQTTFQHIIIVVQENRSVDNLFGDPNTTLPTGANISHVGYFNGNGNGTNPITLTPAKMTADFDPDTIPINRSRTPVTTTRMPAK